MPYPIVTDHRSLVQMADQVCGYRQVNVERGDTGRLAQQGTLVVEHNWRGTADVCRDGWVVSRNQPLYGPVPVPYPYYPQPNHPHHPQPAPYYPQPNHPHHPHHPHNGNRPGIVIRF